MSRGRGSTRIVKRSCNKKFETHIYCQGGFAKKKGKHTNLTIFPNFLDDLSIDKAIIEDKNV